VTLLLAPLFAFPLLLFLAGLPAALAIAGLYQWSGARADSAFVATLRIAALVVAVAALVGLLLFAGLYLLSPGLTDHIEPNTAAVAWLYAEGGQIYHGLDAPERYAFLYGPVPYIATAWVYKLLGPGMFAAKFAGFICLITSLVFVTLAVRRWDPHRVAPCLVALGYFSLVALLFKNHSFWSKPDSFMIACAAVGLYACLLGSSRMAWVLCGLALGIAANAKITGAVYFVPYLAWFFDRDGYRAPLVILLTAAVTGLLPFLAGEQISLLNYIAWLRSAGGHGLSKFLLLQNFVFLLFITLPLALFVVWQASAVGVRSWFGTRKLVVAAALSAALLILIAASKPGSGPHHFLPFLPALAFFTALVTARVSAYRPTTSWCTFVFWAPLGAFLLALTVKAGVALYFGLKVVTAQASGSAITHDLEAIIAANPTRNIYMGYGDGSKYTTTFQRPRLTYAGNPYLIDSSALMDFQYSGIDIPQATIEHMLADDAALWLIPAGQEPFTLANWYFRDTGKHLFGVAFRNAFSSNFHKTGTTDYFDLYVPAKRDPR
jgi:hypothetical protein